MTVELFVYCMGFFIMLVFSGVIIYGVIDSIRMEMYPWLVILTCCLIVSFSTAGYSAYLLKQSI